MNPEATGITGTLFVLASFLAKGERKIRTINIAGALLFVVYGVLTNALSTWLLNGTLVLIHIYYLRKREETT